MQLKLIKERLAFFIKSFFFWKQTSKLQFKLIIGF